ncbi:zwei Ig domain protein zig-8-like [Malaya genurostris]|uniref:zwei Ig domain protein zig-8-like n=1 Tax=Malaya genurostris TaxID=325434 RepID=UPI0026F39E35|nr:zwei Ig domain protein zig-8-like [Malaya genurostris]XP_058462330.1 zwei Ig domain protein zig-8-like [Malaya genurostris]XP_058462331.1 zwei Ig domain protein zig-8-like [Malaya genurostris]
MFRYNYTHFCHQIYRCCSTGRILLLLVLITLDSTDGLYSPNRWPTEPKPKPTQPSAEPYFVTSVSKNATVRQGDPAFLSCKVENLGAYTVSWIRHSDLHILTVNRYTYTADQRFQSLHTNDTDEWILNIKWTERKDTGIYECQISTLPVKSLPLYLIVLDDSDLVRRQDDILYDLPVPVGMPEPKRSLFNEDEYGVSSNSNSNGDIYNRMYSDRDYLFLAATTQILEGTMVYAYKGDNLNLTCIVNHNYDRRPSHVIWYHQNDIVSYESLRKRDKSPPNSITSQHLIRNVDYDDAGNYTCAPELYGSASTIVYILDGDETQEGAFSPASTVHRNFWIRVRAVTLSVVLSLCILYHHPDNAR